MIHPLGYAEGLYSENLNSCFGSRLLFIITSIYKIIVAINSLGYTFQSIRGSLPIESSISWLRTLFKVFGLS